MVYRLQTLIVGLVGLAGYVEDTMHVDMVTLGKKSRYTHAKKWITHSSAV